MNDWLTTILIFLPVAGALALFVVPLGRHATASFALLVSLVEVGFWIESLTRFDFSRGLQFEQRASWFSDLHVSYHVGLYGFSLWLVGLTVVVMAAAIGYAFLVGRERPLILGSATELAVGAQESGRLAARLQSGLVRAYALALAAGVAVLLVVFISVK